MVDNSTTETPTHRYSMVENGCATCIMSFAPNSAKPDPSSCCSPAGEINSKLNFIVTNFLFHLSTQSYVINIFGVNLGKSDCGLGKRKKCPF